MRALVTGGAGFIGSHVVDALIDLGDEVTVVDHLNPARAPVFEALQARGATLVRGEVTEVDAMIEAFRAARPEAVYHLAAQIDVRRSVEDPSLDAHMNIGGTAAVLEAARVSGAGRIVLASTAGVYGDPARLPIAEGTPIAPLSPYGAGKAAAETYLALFSRLYHLSTLSLRMANVYGPRQNPHGEAGVVAIFCSAAANRTTVTIFGDGTQSRDFVYVGDVAQAFVRAGRSTVEGAINISTGHETSLLELTAALGLDIRHGAGRLGEIQRSSLDPALAAEALGWTALTALPEGLEKTLASLAGSAV